MNTADWQPFYKINPEDNSMIETNLIYTPLISPDGKQMCMSFDSESSYQREELASWLPDRPYYTAEMVRFFFEREARYLSEFRDRVWCPDYFKIDFERQQIFFEFSGETCNNIIYSGRSLNEHSTDWDTQLANIVRDIYHSGFLKTSLYPHCFFFQNGVLKTFDFYGCAERSDPYVAIDDIRGMIGETSAPRFATAVEGNYLNVEILFREALESYIVWPERVLQNLHQEFYEQPF